MGLNTWYEFLDNDPARGDINRLADHAEHMIDIMSIDHVGFGFDFCGFLGDPDDPEAYSCMDAVTPGLEDAGMIPSLIGIFRQRGMKDEEIGKIAYGNFHRIIKEAVG